MGVQKAILKEGSKNNKPRSGQYVTLHYIGTLTNGQKFDSSLDRNEPFTFKLGAGEVIKGWDIGVASMCLGEIAELKISPEYGYGSTGAGNDIPPNATLIFQVQLLKIN